MDSKIWTFPKLRINIIIYLHNITQHNKPFKLYPSSLHRTGSHTKQYKEKIQNTHITDKQARLREGWFLEVCKVLGLSIFISLLRERKYRPNIKVNEIDMMSSTSIILRVYFG